MNAPRRDDALLATARALLLEQAGQLSGAQKYQVLMIANAMGIAAREQALGDQVRRDIEQAIAAFYRQAGLPDAPADEARLCRDLRSGAIDAGAHDRALLALFDRIARCRLAIDNPRHLER